MSKNYSVEFLNSLIHNLSPVIIELADDSVHVGILTTGFYRGHYHIRPLTINTSGMGFARSMIKRIIYFNGLIVPKEKNGKHKILDIIELNELVNKAGYEFI